MNELGTARSDAERALEAAIIQVKPWEGRRLRYRPVSGGISNTNFRIEVEGDDLGYFLKIPGRGTEMFINRKAAAAASKQAEAIGVGPKTFDYLDHLDIEIAEFIDGRRASTHKDFADPAIRNEAVRVYRQFHEAPTLPLTKTVFDMIEEHFDQVRALGGHWPLDHDWLFRSYKHARAALEASGLDLVPCFNDPMPGNFLIGDDKSIKLIDFEYASNNERLYDLAIWSGEMFYSEDIDCEIIEEYFGLYNKASHARFIVHKALADIKWSTWAMVQNRISTLDFDFYKYGIWKHMRARSIIHDPRWPLFLKAL
ncbi:MULTISPECIES: choline/ethanolamine kinase family protein [Agrobacterium]|uniref:Choline/ethanolamine kinase--aminoglycoside phosphotransferase n=1 Tax=Agrobacterium tumefaciens TaxID=358 RepID=A0AAE6BHL9_AGRTU|nr:MULTISPECIES: choline/ethanolamine kinase family protein [Agrobacterium]QCL76680.1 choline/ethanolamine kinase--aminoglycoside phosphotransferase [Agrobacterium tumefaciens]QCL82200.1 choline/ethanolamine kinase--aminoglycoside phosphotransferase [Agrobacterium tumefaciens]CUX65267.1 Ethanolamine kinase [Agrobacterium sp. NCPPB 925]